MLTNKSFYYATNLPIAVFVIT